MHGSGPGHNAITLPGPHLSIAGGSSELTWGGHWVLPVRWPVCSGCGQSLPPRKLTLTTIKRSRQQVRNADLHRVSVRAEVDRRDSAELLKALQHAKQEEHETGTSCGCTQLQPCRVSECIEGEAVCSAEQVELMVHIQRLQVLA